MKQFHRVEFKAIVLVLFLGIAFGACEDSYDYYEPDPIVMLMMLNAFSYSYNARWEAEQNVLEDLGDGTVRFTMTDAGYVYANRADIRPRFQVLLRKCPQGFLHDSATNTCSVDPALGGSDPDLAKLQYCDQNSNACNELNGLINGSGNSQVHASCAGETEADLNWRTAHYYTLSRLTRHGDFTAIFPDLKSQWIFASLAASTGTAYVFRSDVGVATEVKTTRRFVLCAYSLTNSVPAK